MPDPTFLGIRVEISLKIKGCAAKLVDYLVGGLFHVGFVQVGLLIPTHKHREELVLELCEGCGVFTHLLPLLQRREHLLRGGIPRTPRLFLGNWKRNSGFCAIFPRVWRLEKSYL